MSQSKIKGRIKNNDELSKKEKYNILTKNKFIKNKANKNIEE